MRNIQLVCTVNKLNSFTVSLSSHGQVTAWKVSKYRVFSGPYFLVFGLYTQIYGVNVRIQSKCRKIRIGKNSLFSLFFMQLVFLIRLRFDIYFSHHSSDDGRSISRNVDSLNTFVHNMIILLYYERWAERWKQVS